MSYESIEKKEKEYGIGGSAFLKIQEGANRIRIVSLPELTVKHWINNQSIMCPGIQGNCEYCKKAMGSPPDVHAKLKARAQYCFVVIDRSDGGVKIAQFPKTIFNEIKNLRNDPDYKYTTDIMPYDITINKKKTGPLDMNVKYSILPGKENPLTEEEKAQVAAHQTIKQYVESLAQKQKEAEEAEESEDTMNDIINDVPFND